MLYTACHTAGSKSAGRELHPSQVHLQDRLPGTAPVRRPEVNFSNPRGVQPGNSPSGTSPQLRPPVRSCGLLISNGLLCRRAPLSLRDGLPLWVKKRPSTPCSSSAPEDAMYTQGDGPAPFGGVHRAPSRSIRNCSATRGPTADSRCSPVLPPRQPSTSVSQVSRSSIVPVRVSLYTDVIRRGAGAHGSQLSSIGTDPSGLLSCCLAGTANIAF